jgi:hypothetical protein
MTGPFILKPTARDLAVGGKKWTARIAADAAGTTRQLRL